MVHAREVQCYLLLLARFFQQGMRNASASLLVYMQQEYNFNNVAKASLIAAVAAGYFATQIPGGLLADRLGAKNVITLAMAGSALCCLAMPTAAAYGGVAGLWWTLAAMGAVQGPLFPTSSVFLGKWTPPDERAWASSALDTGVSVGTLVIVPVAGVLGDAIGWRATYYVVGLASVAFVLLFMMFGASTPDECSFITKEELSFLKRVVPTSKAKKEDAGEGGGDRDLSVVQMLMLPSLWSLFTAHMAFNFGAYFITQWSPTYYENVLHLNPKQAGLHLTLPHVMNLVTKVFCNIPLDQWFVDRGYTQLQRRRLFTAIGFLGVAFCMAPLYAVTVFGIVQSPVYLTTALLSGAMGFYGMLPPGFKANYLDVTVKYTGMVAGIGNTLGTVASFLGPSLVGAVLEKYDSPPGCKSLPQPCDQGWNVVLATIVSVNVIATVVFALFSTTTPIESGLNDYPSYSKVASYSSPISSKIASYSSPIKC